MLAGEMEYNFDRREIVVSVGGNVWRKQTDDPKDIGYERSDRQAEAAFVKAAAPGGEGLERYGYTREGAGPPAEERL